MPGTIRVADIQNAAGKNYITDGGGGLVNIYDLKPKITYRDGSNATQTLLDLNFNEVHVYTTEIRSNTIYIRTACASNALYEVITLSGGGDTQNCDSILYPNNTQYVNQFNLLYYPTTQATGSWERTSYSFNNIYFDHQNGALGAAIMQRWVICTKNDSKYVQFEGMDSGPSLSCGYCRWVNTTDPWSWIGRIYIGPSNADIIRAYVRRLA